VVAVASGTDHVLALTADGDVFSWARPSTFLSFSYYSILNNNRLQRFGTWLKACQLKSLLVLLRRQPGKLPLVLSSACRLTHLHKIQNRSSGTKRLSGYVEKKNDV
jgi:alpha-tubulin suppressor-like RCC1 family protein